MPLLLTGVSSFGQAVGMIRDLALARRLSPAERAKKRRARILNIVWGIIVFLAIVGRGAERPNVLFIAVDDLNDWIGCVGGHPQVQTPNIDRLARRGTLFTNAHCQSPVCNPSRASLMSGLYPESTGIYFLNPPVWESEVAARNAMLPQRFEREGYEVHAAGKLFHSQGNRRYIANWQGNMGGFGPHPEKKLSPFPGHRLWDWGAFPDVDEKMPDHKIATWVESVLDADLDGPQWIGAGFLTTHVPQFTPRKWIDLYPMETLKLPKIVENDLADLPDYGVRLTRLKHIAPTQEWVLENHQWGPLVQTYLACVSFVDHQVGRVLDALEESAIADNTFVVFFSDHGFHLGEKERWAKRSVWRDGAGVPLIIAGPGIGQGAVCDQPVELIDLYPTLLDLCGLESDARLEGHSLRPLLEDSDASWPHLARSSFGPGNVALISESHRYIHYNDGSEELYDRKADPHEWHNLAEAPESAGILEAFRERLPKAYHPILGQGATGHSAYEATEALVER